jgi:prepilin-type N-terminal cleavage/methylation domain-containing protein
VKKAFPNRSANDGFTLVEILVSVGVLVLLVAFVARLMSSATVIAGQGGKRLDSDTQARLVFERMASDFSSMIRRQDVDYIFAKQAGNDTMFFFSEATKYFDSSVSDPAKSSLALVGYRLNSSYQLERLSRGLTWDGQVGPSPAPGSIVFLTPSGTSMPIAGSTIAGNWPDAVGAGPNYTNGTGSDYHVIGDQVYRLEVSFVQTNGTISTSVTSYNGLQNVSAIIVALGMLDTKSRVIAGASNGQIPSPVGIPMVNALPDSVDGTAPLQTWKASNYLTASSIPPAAAAQLRIYERTFYLNGK